MVVGSNSFVPLICARVENFKPVLLGTNRCSQKKIESYVLIEFCFILEMNFSDEHLVSSVYFFGCRRPLCTSKFNCLAIASEACVSFRANGGSRILLHNGTIRVNDNSMPAMNLRSCQIPYNTPSVSIKGLSLSCHTCIASTYAFSRGIRGNMWFFRLTAGNLRNNCRYKV